MNAKQERKATAIIEQAIDEFGLSNVLDVMEGICNEKATHVRNAYGDGNLARTWVEASVHVGKAASMAMLKGL